MYIHPVYTFIYFIHLYIFLAFPSDAEWLTLMKWKLVFDFDDSMGNPNEGLYESIKNNDKVFRYC